MGFDFFQYLGRESVTYYPGGDTASAIECEGVIIRSPVTRLNEHIVRTAEVWIPRGNLAGKVSTIEVGQDEMLLRIRPYQPMERCRVTRLLTSDDYAWKVQVTR